MAVSASEFRNALGHLAGGVTLVTSRDASGEPRGLTATAVTSVSLAPPMVLVCVGTNSDTNGAISESGSFAISMLGADHAELANRFASDTVDKFAGLASRPPADGIPVPEVAVAWCRATVVHEVPAGDHTVFIGRVEEVGTAGSPDPAPLVHYRGRYAEVRSAEPSDGT